MGKMRFFVWFLEDVCLKMVAKVKKKWRKFRRSVIVMNIFVFSKVDVLRF